MNKFRKLGFIEYNGKLEASRDTERLAQPTCRPDPPVLRNETELHVDSFAK